MERVLRNTPSTLSVTFYSNETPADPDANAVTFTARKADGTIAYTGSATRTGVGVYTWLFAAQAFLMNYTLSWVGNFGGVPVTITTELEIVGGNYFTVAEMRAYDSVLNSVAYPYDEVVYQRQQVEAEFERICGRAFVPRFARETLTGDGSNELWLDNPEVTDILTLTIAGVNYISYESSLRVSRDHSKMIYFTEMSGLTFLEDEDIVIEYEYGMKKVPPQISDKAKKRTRGLLMGKNARIDDRISVIDGDFGRFNMATPGMDMGFGRYVRSSMGVWHTGIPDVDVVLEDYIYEPQGVA